MSVSLARVDRTEKLSLRDMEVHDGCSRAQSLPLRSCCHVDSAQGHEATPQQPLPADQSRPPLCG